MTRTLLDAAGAVIVAIVLTKTVEAYGKYKYRQGLADAKK